MPTRRNFLTASTLFLARPLFADPPSPGKDPLTAGNIVEIDPTSGAELQAELNRHTGSRNTLRLKKPRELVCLVREELVEGEKSVQPLLIPAGVNLDLQGAILLLDCRSNSYGVRLSNDSAIRNGTIEVVVSEGKGSQGCWHSGISVGAAYGDGGSTAHPGHFSSVKNWEIDNITIDQPFEASAVQLMSEAHHGRITNVSIPDSPKALLGIGMDWGSVGEITTEDREVPRMRRLWEEGRIYSTHPHHVLIDNLKVGKLSRGVDGNDAGVRCSACHDITIRNVEVAEAGVAVAIFGGDFGYEFARQDQRAFQHQGYRIENVKIDRALIFGIVLNGSADNIHRAVLNHGYVPLRDPVHPGIDRAVVRNLQLTGGGERANRQGVYAVAARQVRFENSTIRNFGIGLHVEDWVDGLHFEKTAFSNNATDKLIEGATEPAKGVTFSG